MDDYPFVAEYSKSSRASCKICKITIQKDELRIGVMIQSPKFDGKIPLWHHFKCFFQKKQIGSTDEIGHFASLRFEDQQLLKEKVGKPPENLGKTPKGKGKAAAASNTPFSVEYSKSSRAACKVCNDTIKKGVVRISKLDCDSDAARRYGPVPGWHHVDCFVRVKDSLGFDKSAEDLPGFASLEDEDKTELKSKLKGKPAKKRPATDAAEEKKPVDIPVKKIKKELSDEDKALKVQSDLLFGFRDKLEAELSKKDMVQLLEANDQYVPSGESKLLDVISDMLAFGALKRCPECRGQLRIRDRGYKCQGQVTEWTGCVYTTDSPKRKKVIIPEELSEKSDCLKDYQFVKRSRVFPPKAESSNNGSSTSSANSKPLNKFKIVLVGFYDSKRQELEKTIVSLGGEVSKKISKTTTCVVACEDNKDEFKKGMKSAQKSNVTVVSESFLDAAKKGKAAYLLKEHSIKPWGIGISDGASTSRKSLSAGSSSNQSGQKMKKVVVKGVVETDEDSGLAGKADVLVGKYGPYNCVLGMVDISRGTNSYYKLQLLKSKSSNNYHVFRSWGRVGTTIGSNKTERFSSRESAVEEFERLYLEKTGNEWKFKDKFVKMPNHFYPLDIDYGQNDMDETLKLEPGKSSRLPKPVQELICLIFDVAAMKRALMEFEIDLQKMPLGKLSKNQIMQAYEVLTELQNLLKDPDEGKPKNGSSHVKILDASNRFYTLIPHDFGLDSPPLLDSEEAIKSKTGMLDSLLEIECAYKLLNSGDSQMDPIDNHYEQLKTDIEVLAKDSEEYKIIQTYLKNTHAPTHAYYNLVLEEVFKISRHGEMDRYRSKCKEVSEQKKLLWHGSRVTNFAGILSQGLRIAPPEAPATGYMFGKGIYFADMVSKSANYCYTNQRSPTGLLLLCEVALGNMSEKTAAHYVEKLPKDKHSVKGIGMTIPDPKQTIVKNGVEIPIGKPISAPVKNSSLLYNEYIVYDVNQVNIKYLLKVKFDFKH